MQHVLKVDPDYKMFIVVTQGDATAQGIQAFLDDIIAHPSWQPGMPILLDHRHLYLHNIEVDEVKEVSDYFASISGTLGNGKIALVMNREVDFGIARAWENMTIDRTGMHTHVCRTMEEARAWLMEPEPDAKAASLQPIPVPRSRKLH